jgi:hypothetical protein
VSKEKRQIAQTPLGDAEITMCNPQWAGSV